MPSRNQTIIRRDINRLNETIERRKTENPALASLSPIVKSSCDAVNKAWQKFQDVAVRGDKERAERDQAIGDLISWVQRWRPIILLTVPGAGSNIRNLPSSGATPDDVIRVAGDMVEFLNKNAGASSIKTPAITDLGKGIENAKKETEEASAVLPEEASARSGYTDACISANEVLVKGLDVIRAIFGKTSPEYKIFIAKASAKEEEEIEAESKIGEE